MTKMHAKKWRNDRRAEYAKNEMDGSDDFDFQYVVYDDGECLGVFWSYWKSGFIPDHGRSNMIWDFFKHYSRDLETGKIIYHKNVD